MTFSTGSEQPPNHYGRCHSGNPYGKGMLPKEFSHQVVGRDIAVCHPQELHPRLHAWPRVPVSFDHERDGPL